MTGKKIAPSVEGIEKYFVGSSLSFELCKSKTGAVALISGVVGVSECSSECVELLSHSGRVLLIGDHLKISLLENKTLEIYGKIKEVRLSYGKT